MVFKIKKEKNRLEHWKICRILLNCVIKPYKKKNKSRIISCANTATLPEEAKKTKDAHGKKIHVEMK